MILFDEAGTAAMKAVELDAVLGSRAVQYRELQSYESNRFLSYFKPCLMPLEGGFSSGLTTPEEENFETRLYTCEGKRVVRLKQVPFNRSSLNHDEIFILDTKDKIFQFNGENTNNQERCKALEVIQLLKEKHHEGKCNVAIIDDGKLQEEGQSGEFWALFDGFAPIGKKVASEDDIIPEKTPAQLYNIVGGQLQDVVGELSKSLLRTDKCYMLYCGTDVFIWVGRATRLEDRKTAMQTVEEYIVNQNLPKLTLVTRIIQGHETNSFKSKFGSWTSASAAAPFEEGRGKVAALLKQQGAVLKGQTKTPPVEEEVPPLLPENGEIEVWHIDGESKTPVPKEDIGKFYSGDCYICLYSYHSNDKDHHYLCSWIGKDSIQEDQTIASQQATLMFKSFKCRAVQGRVFQGKEPPQFVAIFQPIIVLKGGLSSGYKSYIADKGLKDDTYSPDTPALIEISGTSMHNNKALQVDVSGHIYFGTNLMCIHNLIQAAGSLNSYGCFILQSATAALTWHGNQSTVEQQQLAVKVIEFLKPGAPIKLAKEGKESLAFWLALGGKQSYNSKKVTQEIVREPHLFEISSNKGKFEIEEIYNFEQDDLLAEDVMILDTHAEVIVWVGQSVDPKEKQNAFETGQKYIDLAASVDGLSPHVPLYRVAEGCEPCFFTTYFSWDPSKAPVQGNSFKKKAMILFGPGTIEVVMCILSLKYMHSVANLFLILLKSHDKKPEGSKGGGGATQRASAMAALTSAFQSSTVTKTAAAPRTFNRASQRAAAVAALSNVLTAEKKAPSPDSPPNRHDRKIASSQSTSPTNSEIADQGIGIEIWRIENFNPVPLPKSDYGRFYYGDSYIILKTAGKAGAYTYDIHYWLGKDTSQDEAGTAAMKAVELDAVLGSRAVQYRELQSYESNRFLSYFKPCLMPLEGGFSSGLTTPEEENFETRLYTCEGKRVVRLKQVPFNRSSLNHDEIFILDTKDKIFQFNGENTNNQERYKALEVIQLLKEKHHEGKCNVAIIDDGKLQEEGQSGEFWALFDGFAPIGKKVASEDDIIPEKTPAQLYNIVGGQLQDVVGELSKSLLRTDKCYMLYCGTDVFIWVGRATRLEDRKTAMQTVEEYIVNQNLPKLTLVTRIIQGHETNSFKSKFGSWTSASAAAPFEEGRGKVAALLKQQGAVLKGQTKTPPVEEEVPPLLPENGEIEVWHIDGESKTPVPKEDIGKFYSGDCYICLYSYHSNDKDHHYLCSWIGKDSIQEDQTIASQQATLMFKSFKCRAVQGRVFQGKEPPQFVAIFQPIIVLKGGLSSGYKSYIVDKGLKDDTYSPDTPALIEISGTSMHNNKALQVDVAAGSLNSYGCFILQSATAALTWHGNQSTVEQQQLAVKVIEFLKPGAPIKLAKEGKESLAFWLALGGKQSYNSKKVTQEIVREPHLFEISSNKGKFEIEEIYNFEHDDLLAEDVMILDTHAEVIVWVGQSVDPKEKQNAFETGQKYIDLAASVDGLSPYVPLYRVAEGCEPCFFTTYFSWDPSKAPVQGNSFKKKAMILFGPGTIEVVLCILSLKYIHSVANLFLILLKSHDKKPEGSKGGGGATQRASAMAALTSAFQSSTVTKTAAAPRTFNRASQRAAAVAALSNVLTAEKKAPSPDSPPNRHDRKIASSQSTSPTNSEIADQAPVKSEEPSNISENDEVSEPTNETTEEVPEIETSEPIPETETSEPVPETNEDDSSVKETDEDEKGDTQSTYTYDQLKSKSTDPVTGIDFKKRETYLSPEEFEEIFKMTKEKFYGLPRWRQDQIKKKVDLF
ncbi:hypothetical protein SSX86_015158 [Deinandra increscens subsp. villosa]|uniref:HP domain-containing protein n=1 Tax=Deinandra increscens subsp. villosa TaxID=3103831 RepID=A0AAP0GZ07_9ASTR